MSTLEDVLADLAEVIGPRRGRGRAECREVDVEIPGFLDCRGVLHTWDEETTE